MKTRKYQTVEEFLGVVGQRMGIHYVLEALSIDDVQVEDFFKEFGVMNKFEMKKFIKDSANSDQIYRFGNRKSPSRI